MKIIKATCLCGNIFDIEHEWLSKVKVVSCDKCRKIHK